MQGMQAGRKTEKGHIHRQEEIHSDRQTNRKAGLGPVGKTG